MKILTYQHLLVAVVLQDQIEIFREEMIQQEEVLQEAGKAIEKLQERTYTTVDPKRTCIHISPDIYLQRKGGGTKDSRPDDIQTKLKSFPEGTMTVIYEKL
jgi:hypothetical protein